MPEPEQELAPFDERLHELAAGWSGGDLSESEQRELLARLQGPDGPREAQVVWAHLDTASELKGHLSPVLTDSVKLRIARAGSGRFVNEARRRLGLARPGLAPAADPPTPGGGRARRILAVVAAVLAIAGLAAWLALRSGRSEEVVARVLTVEGVPTLSGEALAVGAGVDPRSLVVPAGARLALAWPSGATAELSGPAMAVAQAGGIALQAGSGRFASVRELRVGLPDRQLRLLPGVAVAVAVDGTRSTVGCAAGAVAVGGHVLAAGEAVSDGAPFAWRALEALPAAAEAGVWRSALTVQWQGEGGSVALRLDPDTALAFRPGRVVVTRSGAEQPRGLPGAPLADLQVELAWRRPRLEVRVGSEPILAADLPGLAPAVTAQGAQVGIAGFTGPAPPR